MNFEYLRDWIGKQQTAVDVLAEAPLAGLAALLNYDAIAGVAPWRDGALPPLGHWLHFLLHAKQSEIGEDGHPQRGGFLPPVELPRRMWAGGTVYFDTPLRVGSTVQRRSTITAVDPKSGRHGNLVFVTVKHELIIAGSDAPALIEHQDIVYREAAVGGQVAVAPSVGVILECDWSREFRADPVLLFRFSALTFNGHRIHYDRAYASDVEGYPGLVVHGPLSATLLVDLFLRRHPGADVRAFSFRGLRPLFDTRPFQLCGKETGNGADLWILDADGQIAMSASLEAR
ncbi:3-methylfumaryl-CoA hydratase [Paraburkholderia sp. BL27I4N3]|uniref:FAS1-like dehydratase domain-containing protein n=1 Tax=Paraburkholderia sp. BL27I4N3 TaxID=1938805 RepID=UPI000E254D6B|nr:MaoC family dehydratase N-terminal domain-containing protein [Paraburkholderia sp. BL27I4N3]REE07401.1 3-methylfumaryl-CoA hydratase [Paraburkholderia sp. BL27I4N3]